MKICWDMLEGVCLTRSGTFRKGSITYIYKESCIKCGEPYLTEKASQSIFCSTSCVRKGRKLSDEIKKKISITNTGKTRSVKIRREMSEVRAKRSAVSIPIWQEDVKGQALTVYDSHKDKLGLYEEIRKQVGTEVLEARCAYCNRWFSPTYEAVRHRLVAINYLNRGEQRLYCSENCKFACPTYNREKYPKGFKHTTSREVSTYLRQLVLERDNWTCQICGKTINEVQLHVHHMDPVSWNPMFQNDMDSCITLCKGCHKMVHSRIGCRYIDLVCKKVG